MLKITPQIGERYKELMKMFKTWLLLLVSLLLGRKDVQQNEMKTPGLENSVGLRPSEVGIGSCCRAQAQERPRRTANCL